MDKKRETKNIKKVLDAFEQMKEDVNKAQRKADEKLWQDIELPVSLETALGHFSKSQLDNIRKNYDFKGISNLKKANLIEKLSLLLLKNFNESLTLWDSQSYSIVKAIVDNSGYIPVSKADMEMIRVLMYCGIVFPGKYENEKVLYIPTELIEQFNKVDKSFLEEIIIRNEQWTQLTQGMLYYYGVLPYFTTIDKVREILKSDIRENEFLGVLELWSKLNRLLVKWERGYKLPAVTNPVEILNEQNSRPGINYYPFTKEQLLKAGKPSYLEQTDAVIKFKKFLDKYYDISNPVVANEMVRHLVGIINSTGEPTGLMDYLEKRLEVPNKLIEQELEDILKELYNTTRQWMLKGHTPNEVFKGRNKSNPKVVNINRNKRGKIGRNEPCPCGSGKKYKKCCDA